MCCFCINPPISTFEYQTSDLPPLWLADGDRLWASAVPDLGGRSAAVRIQPSALPARLAQDSTRLWRSTAHQGGLRDKVPSLDHLFGDLRVLAERNNVLSKTEECNLDWIKCGLSDNIFPLVASVLMWCWRRKRKKCCIGFLFIPTSHICLCVADIWKHLRCVHERLHEDECLWNRFCNRCNHAKKKGKKKKRKKSACQRYTLDVSFLWVSPPDWAKLKGSGSFSCKLWKGLNFCREHFWRECFISTHCNKSPFCCYWPAVPSLSKTRCRSTPHHGDPALRQQWPHVSACASLGFTSLPLRKERKTLPSGQPQSSWNSPWNLLPTHTGMKHDGKTQQGFMAYFKSQRKQLLENKQSISK